MNAIQEVQENVKRVLEQAAAAAVKAGRDPAEITVVAATKMNDAQRVQAAIQAGITIAGENRVQELTSKNAEHAYTGAKLHLIGHLQKNKVKQVVGICDCIQSVDSIELAERISARAEQLQLRQTVFAEINIGGEEAKSGMPVSALDPFLEACSALPGIQVLGMMTIPPICEKKCEVFHYFDAMYQLFVDTKRKKYDNVSMQFLSMGMSGDFREAILAGSNMIRVGTSIFGSRYYG